MNKLTAGEHNLCVCVTKKLKIKLYVLLIISIIMNVLLQYSVTNTGNTANSIINTSVKSRATQLENIGQLSEYGHCW